MKHLLLLMTVLAVHTAVAQTIHLSGKVTDRQGRTVDMATVVVKDSLGTVINGGITDTAGCFNLQGIPQGTFSVSISYVGYNDYSQQVRNAHKDVHLEAVLDAVATDLKEVVVTSKTPLIRREIDRITLNAEKLNATASNFLDVLKHTPGVLVGEDDISMLGKGKLIFLLNGREVMMDMKSLMVYLGSQPSDNLKQIEVMTTPPAKYSAEGNAGVINFVTKKTRENYLGGYASNQLAIKEQVYDDANLSLQYKQDRLEAYVNASAGLGDMQTNTDTYVYYPSETWSTERKRVKSNHFVFATAGADYALTKNASIGTILSYTGMQPDADTEARTTVMPSNTTTTSKYFETFTDFDDGYNQYLGNLHYTLNNIGKGGTLGVNADILYYDIKDHVDLQTTQDESLSYLNHSKVAIDIYQMKVDMEMPIGAATLSYGAAYSLSKTDHRTAYDRISTGEDLNDYFVYREQILAAYTDARLKLSEKWEAKVGVRGEYGKLDGNSIKLDTRNVKHQFDLFPTAFLKYSWDENNVLSLSVSSRINRPSYVDINPFTTYLDAHTVQTGNPNLMPEKSYTAELGYTLGNFSVSASAMWKDQKIFSYISIDDALKLTSITEDNVMKQQMYNLNVSYYFDRFSWFDSSIDCSVYNIASQPMAGYDLEEASQTSVFIYTNHNFYLNKQRTLLANIWGQYQSKEKDITGESPARYRVDASMKYLLCNKKLSIGITYQNMLASHSKSITYSGDVKYVYDYNPYRVLKLNISYKFGKQLNIKQKSFGIDTNRL